MRLHRHGGAAGRMSRPTDCRGGARPRTVGRTGSGGAWRGAARVGALRDGLEASAWPRDRSGHPERPGRMCAVEATGPRGVQLTGAARNADRQCRRSGFWLGERPSIRTFENCGKKIAECNSARRGRPGSAEPEVWFRIVHGALEGHDGAPVVAFGEQAVEIALGPNGAFESGNIGTLTRRVPADRIVSAVPPRRGLPKPPRGPKPPRVVELLRRAIEWQALLESGQTSNQAAISRREGITRARVTQVMGLLRLGALAPKVRGSTLRARPGAPRLSRVTSPDCREIGPKSETRRSRIAQNGRTPAAPTTEGPARWGQPSGCSVVNALPIQRLEPAPTLGLRGHDREPEFLDAADEVAAELHHVDIV